MRKALIEQTRRIELTAARLRGGYDVEQLHDLRVAIRRIRSLLKQRGKGRARRWRRIWGSFARVTGRARDWDVFLETAANLLQPSRVETLVTLCGHRVQSARNAVRIMLESSTWRLQVAEWKAYAARDGASPSHRTYRLQAADATGTDRLKPVLTGANRALAVALAQEDDSSWHRFRIAVKELRYLAERLPPGNGDSADPRAVIDACKALQDLLGSWHDCIVQLRLLGELEAGTGASNALLHELREAIEQRRQQRLAEIHDALAEQETLRPAVVLPG